MNNDHINNTQQEGWKTYDDRMTKKCSARLCIPNLSRHCYAILPSWVFQPSCCVSSLIIYTWLFIANYLLNKQFSVVLFDKVTLATIGKLVLEIISITTLNGQLLIPLPESSRWIRQNIRGRVNFMVACISEDTQEALNVLQVLLAVLFFAEINREF